jgi:hypothetical protein
VFSRASGPVLPMIDVTLTKENALPFDLWGLIYEGWKPNPAEASRSFCRDSKSAATTIFASESTSRP